MRKSLCFLSVSASLMLTACATALSYLPVYSIDIQQGNIVDQAMVDQLRPNMTKRQVLYVLGSPMLDDAFHQKRWDYIYSEQRNGEDRKQKRIALFFNDEDQITSIQGDFKPGVAPQFKTTPETTVDVPKRDVEKTMWEKIIGLFGYDGIDEPPSKINSKLKETSETNLPL